MLLRSPFSRSLPFSKGMYVAQTARLNKNLAEAFFYGFCSVGSNKAFRFGVIGSGPAGMHISKQILKDIPDSCVDIYDKMPFPFGLVRTGVAPDHQEVKNVTKEFTKVGENKRCNFYGNVEVGTDISLKELRKHYSGLILAYGAEGDRRLWLEGEDQFKGIYAARAIVNWYNSHPEHNYMDEKLFKDHDMKNIIIIGNGNVAIDVARIFSKRIDDLKSTDINEKVLELKKKSSTENIFVVGRRGCIQAAFTTKELRELFKMEDVELYLIQDDINSSLTEASTKEYTDPLDFRFRANKRKFELLKTAKILNSEKELEELLKTKPKGTRIIFRFLMSPVKLNGEDGKISSVEFCKNVLKGEAFSQVAREDASQGTVKMDCDVLLRSIGYQSKPIENVIFDKKNHIIPNSNGCVLAEGQEDMIEVGLYVTGWIKTGPIGVIDTTLKDSLETFVNVKQHHLKGLLREKEDPKEVIEKILRENKVKFTTFQDWQKVNKVELERGEKLQKCREKVKTREEYFNLLQ